MSRDDSVNKDKSIHFFIDDTVDIGKEPTKVSETDKKIIDKMNKEIQQGKYNV